MKLRYTLLLMLTLLASLPMVAQQKSKKVQQLEQQRKEAIKAIEKTDKELSRIKNDKNKKQQEAALLKKKVAQRQELVRALDNEIKELSGDIDSLARQEQELRTQEEERKAAYERSVLALQKRKNSTDRMLFVLSASAFDEAIRRMRFVSQYANAHKRAAEELKVTRTALEHTRQAIEVNRKSKSQLLVQREQEKAQLEKERQQRTGEVAQLQGQEKDLQQQRKKQQQQVAALNRKIEQQIAAEIAEAERKAREEEERRKRLAEGKGNTNTEKGPAQEERKAATKGGYPMTAEERRLGGSFAQNKGNLPAPVNNNYRIIGTFGVQQHNELSRVQTNNNGIDLEVPQGTSARAVFEGKVTSVFVIEGNKAAIIIRHGNYLTVYSNITGVTVRKGQEVKAHQILGKVAIDSFSNKAILNFQVWHERSKQNPQAWIR
nr:peptidoglycan DD-metalloendopeptidase family protein [uncultured Porphyromonas sp.]